MSDGPKAAVFLDRWHVSGHLMVRPTVVLDSVSVWDPGHDTVILRLALRSLQPPVEHDLHLPRDIAAELGRRLMGGGDA